MFASAGPGLDPATLPQFVAAGTLSVQDVLARFPAGPAHRGRYVRVSNLYGYIDGVMRCGMDTDTGVYFWQPTTPEYGRSVAVTGNMTLMRLLSPVTAILTGTIGLGITRTVTIDTSNGRPGEVVEVKNGLGTMLGALNLAGTGIGSALSVPLGGYMKFVIDASGGQLQLVRLI